MKGAAIEVKETILDLNTANKPTRRGNENSNCMYTS